MASLNRLPQMLTLSQTVDASGDLVTTTGTITGTLRMIRVEVGTLATTVDITVVGATTGINYLTNANMTADETFYPMAATTDPADGSAAADPAFTPFQVAEALTITLDEGGVSKTGTVHILYD